MATQSPILSAPPGAPTLAIGASRLIPRIRSSETHGAFAVVEFISDPGEGVGLHIHENEDEFVYLLEGQIEVTLGEEKLTVPQGACALLPRNIPHGYINTGGGASRLLAVLLPGGLDEFFEELDRELATDRPHEEPIARLSARFGLRFIEPARQ